MPEVGQAFIDRSRSYLRSEYLPKIRRCLEEIPPEDLWWRPNPASNSIGNLLLHLAGNVRQWVISGIGGEPDHRQRGKEFAADAEPAAGELLELLEGTVEAVDRVLVGLDPDRLLEPRRIQGRDVTVLDALYHATEHFAMHTGQIIYITKLRTGRDLRFYDVEDGLARPAWDSA